jgi:hypothetical protein
MQKWFSLILTQGLKKSQRFYFEIKTVILSKNFVLLQTSIVWLG